MTTQDLKLLTKLVACKSVQGNNGDIEECLKILENAFGGKFFVKRIQSAGQPMLLLSTVEGNNFDFILSGHIDVVSAADEQFSLSIKSGRLYGRGVFDMKGPLLAGICAIRDFLAISKQPTKSIAIIVSSDEETGGASMKALLEGSKYKAKFALIPDGGSEYEIIVGQKGFLQLKINVLGKSAHASVPSAGINPIETVMELKNHLYKLFPQPQEKDDWQTTIVLTKINSGISVNQIPETAEAYFDIRYIKNEHQRQIIREIKKYLGKMGICEIVAENSAFEVDLNNLYVKKLSGAIEKNIGKKPSMARESGSSDAVFFTENNIPAALFRPVGGSAHEKGEWVNEKSLQSFYQIVYMLLENL